MGLQGIDPLFQALNVFRDRFFERWEMEVSFFVQHQTALHLADAILQRDELLPDFLLLFRQIRFCVTANGQASKLLLGEVLIDLEIKTLAVGVNEHDRFYHIGGFKGGRWYNKQLDKIRSKRERCKKGSNVEENVSL